MSVSSTNQRIAHIRARVRDFILYIAIGFAFVAVLITVARSSASHDAIIRWGGLAFMSAILFGYFISSSGQFFRRWQFWALTTILLSVHLGAFAVILTHVDEWKLIWFTGMALKYPAFVFFRSRLPYPSET